MKQNNEALWKQRAFYVVKKETIMELMVPIENKDDTPLYEQIYTYIKGEIRAGRLRAGSRLPFYQDPCRQSSCKQKYHPVGL